MTKGYFGALGSGKVLDTDYVAFEVEDIHVETYQSEAQAVYSGPTGQRSAQRGYNKYRIAGAGGGLNPMAGIRNIDDAIDQFVWNPGVQTRVPGVLGLPYALNTGSTFTSDEDISGAVAANNRVHAYPSSLNTSYQALYECFRKKMWGPTSGSDATPKVLASFTDQITAAGELVVNGTRVFAVAGKGATDDLKYTTTPDSPSWTTLVALSSGDYITTMGYIVDGPGYNVVIGRVGGVDAVWWFPVDESAPVTLQYLVSLDSINQKGTLSTTTITDQDPSYVNNEGTGTQADDAGVAHEPGTWDNASSATTSDDSRATFAIHQATTNTYPWATSKLVPTGYDISSRPLASFLEGVSFSVEWSVSNTSGLSAMTMHAQLLLDGAAAGVVHSSDALTISTSDATVNFGDASDKWGLGDVSDFTSVGVQIWFTGTRSYFTPAATDIRVDRIRMTNFKYRPGGATIGFPVGGDQLNKNGVFPKRITFRCPLRDEAGAITINREIWHLDFAWQADQQRPAFTLSQPNEGMPNTWAGTPHQGGYLLVGGDKPSDRGLLVKHLDSSGNLRDYAFFGVHGSYTAKIIDILSHGSWAVANVAYYDSNGNCVDRQWVALSPGLRWHPDWLLQTYSNYDCDAEPIPHAQIYGDAQFHQMRTFWPEGTHASAAWTFLPPDLSADHRVNYTDQVRTMAWSGTQGSRTEDTAIELKLPVWNAGNEEHFKTLLGVDYIGNSISSSGGAAGSVTVEVEANGADFTTPDVSNEFTSEIESYNVPSGGLAYKYLQLQLKFQHEAGTVKSPDGSALLLKAHQQGPHLMQLVAYCSGFTGGLMSFLKAMETVKSTAYKGVHTFYLEPAYAGISTLPGLFVSHEGYRWPQTGIPADAMTSEKLPGNVQVGVILATKPGTPVNKE